MGPSTQLEPNEVNGMVTYEQRLDRDRRWALLEGSRHFEKESAVHKALQRIAQKLDGLGIPYAVAGGMALFFHGYRRFTEVVDILVTREGLQEIHRQLEGRGYVLPFEGSKNLRESDSGVRIEFLVAGDYPGDGKPKPVAFPNPDTCRVEMGGIQFLQLPALIELKLASGMTNPGRIRDLADVQELIGLLRLSEGFAEQLNPYVRDKYRELWTAVHNDPAASG
jgi:hypothetical protein